MKTLVVFLAFFVPALTFAAPLTTEQATSLISVVQSSPTTPASAFTSLITSFSNITDSQANSLIKVVQAAPGVPAYMFIDLLQSFTVDTVATQATQTQTTQTNTQPTPTLGTAQSNPQPTTTQTQTTPEPVVQSTHMPTPLDISNIKITTGGYLEIFTNKLLTSTTVSNGSIGTEILDNYPKDANGDLLAISDNGKTLPFHGHTYDYKLDGVQKPFIVTITDQDGLTYTHTFN